MTQNPWLVAGGVLSGFASLLHLAVIVGGPAWYRFFGAGERMARMAERGELQPTLVTLGIAGVLAAWAAYAFSGAGLIARLPLLNVALVLITAICLLRGLALLPALAFQWVKPTPFIVWSSLIVLGYGLVHLVGVWRLWRG